MADSEQSLVQMPSRLVKVIFRVLEKLLTQQSYKKRDAYEIYSLPVASVDLLETQNVKCVSTHSIVAVCGGNLPLKHAGHHSSILYCFLFYWLW